MRCRHCNTVVTCDHYCHNHNRLVSYNDSSNFIESMLITEMTGDPLLGALIGGSAMGAIVGESILEDSSCNYSSDICNSDWSSDW